MRSATVWYSVGIARVNEVKPAAALLHILDCTNPSNLEQAIA